MTSEPRAKEYLWQLIVGTVSTVLGGVVLALNWAAVKAFFTGVNAGFANIGAWLMGTTEVYRVVMLADFLVLAVVLAWVALWWRRGRASTAPVVSPVSEPVPRGDASKYPEGNPKVADGFEPGQLQLMASHVLCECYPRKLQLPDLAAAMQTLTRSPVRVAPQAEIARQMEDMLVNGVAVIVDPDSATTYYGLTRNGRDFMLAAMGKTLRRP
jgi:hypothetical protein